MGCPSLIYGPTVGLDDYPTVNAASPLRIIALSRQPFDHKRFIGLRASLSPSPVQLCCDHMASKAER